MRTKSESWGRKCQEGWFNLSFVLNQGQNGHKSIPHSLFVWFGVVEEGWMISWISNDQQGEVVKLGKEVVAEEDQVPPSSLVPLVICAETVLEWTQKPPPTFLLFGLEWWRKVG
jgi:hypothetical protein